MARAMTVNSLGDATTSPGSWLATKRRAASTSALVAKPSPTDLFDCVDLGRPLVGGDRGSARRYCSSGRSSRLLPCITPSDAWRPAILRSP